MFGLGFRVLGLWFGGSGVGCRVSGAVCRVKGVGVGVSGLRCMAWDSGCRVLRFETPG